MSTYDVPGANPANKDELAMGCWAEHDDGSLLFVESTEGGRVIYSMFDMSKTPPVEYRDAMPQAAFKSSFTWKPDKKKSEKWKWHDKTPFPWDKVIDAGASDGPKYASAHDQLSAAQRVAEALKLDGSAFDRDVGHLTDLVREAAGTIAKSISKAIRKELRK